MSDSVIVTCFKRKGDRSGDSFVTGGGNSTPEWELLKSDAVLNSLKCEFRLVEYDDIRALPNGYDKKVDTALYIDVRHGEDYLNSAAYSSVLYATHIAAFVAEFAKKFHNSTAIVVRTETPRATTQETAIVVAPETPFVHSWKLPTVVVGGFMFLALLTGAIIFFDWRRRKGSTLNTLTPFFLSNVPEKSEHVNFAQIKKKNAQEASPEEAEL
jgi:hypothetical protein